MKKITNYNIDKDKKLFNTIKKFFDNSNYIPIKTNKARQTKCRKKVIVVASLFHFLWEGSATFAGAFMSYVDAAK